MKKAKENATIRPMQFTREVIVTVQVVVESDSEAGLEAGLHQLTLRHPTIHSDGVGPDWHYRIRTYQPKPESKSCSTV